MENFNRDAKIFKSLSDENRLQVLNILKNGEKCGYELLEELKISQPTLSHHMKILCEAGIVKSKRRGKLIFYTISNMGYSIISGCIEKYVKL